ncbi:hypothetical protein DPMN_017402 [Dreissena polymorpha]|uniref:Uncharacterized protein n=1 Tax=Dreissena polymorpha TaxID=45954 RepID=A0A9D4NEM0_DREPO|nr:hypothetical protein DPMN_017402 [Dreissena polymorpha]
MTCFVSRGGSGGSGMRVVDELVVVAAVWRVVDELVEVAAVWRVVDELVEVGAVGAV